MATFEEVRQAFARLSARKTAQPSAHETQLAILQSLRDVKAILREHTELLCELLPERPTMVLPVVTSGDADEGGQ